ncbi:hypothetical protein oki184_30970 [Helicobacter pylori]|nr:hypothetical protein KUHPSE09_01220 [Staphylococcus epidermidis]
MKSKYKINNYIKNAIVISKLVNLFTYSDVMYLITIINLKYTYKVSLLSLDIIERDQDLTMIT